MTPEQAVDFARKVAACAGAAYANQGPDTADAYHELIACVDAMITQARAEEREACIKLLGAEMVNRPSDPPANYFDGGLRTVVDIIRARKDGQ